MVFVAWLLGCVSQEMKCEQDADCTPGICSPSGTCILVETDTGVADTGVDSEDTVDSDVEGDVCVPDQNGILTSSEYPSVSDIQVPFLYSEDSPVELTANNATWNFSDTLNGQRTVMVSTEPMADFWFAETFPSASYVTVLSHRNELYGVFTLSEDQLTLDGVASFDSGWTETLLVYDPPVKILDFPLAEGQTWSTESTVTGTLNGVFSYHTELHNMTVDASGDLTTTLGQFPVLRVHTNTVRTVGVLQYTSHSMSFLAECYGVVVTAASELDEPAVEFDTAFELLRMAP